MILYMLRDNCYSTGKKQTKMLLKPHAYNLILYINKINLIQVKIFNQTLTSEYL